MSGFEPASSQVKLVLRKATAGSTFATASYTNCTAQSGSSTISKNGNVVTALFSNVNDYNSHKSSYQTALASAGMTNYSSNNTLIEYYKFFIFHFVLANSCGDTKVDKYFYTHYSNPPVFDDASMTITLNLASISNNYSAVNSCDNTSANIIGMINSINAGMNAADFSSATNVRGAANPVVGVYITQSTTDDTATPKIFMASVRAPGIDACDLSVKGWSSTRGLNADQWQFDLFWDRITVTNAADPINNFKLERLMDNNGVPLASGSYITVYEIIGGVVQ
jgi:hypothetical protein